MCETVLKHPPPVAVELQTLGNNFMIRPLHALIESVGWPRQMPCIWLPNEGGRG